MKRQLFLNILLIAGIIIISFACKPDQQGSGSQPGVSGKPGEILVVMDTAQFNKKPGLAIKKELQRAQRALPQAEPIFNLVNIPPHGYKDVFQRYRNILLIDIDEKYSKPRFAVRKNVNAEPQMIINAQASNFKSLRKLFLQQGETIAEKYIEAERNRYINTYKNMRNKGVMKRVKEKFGVELVIPKGYSLALDTTDFVWIENEARDYTQGILIYKHKYESDQAFEINNIMDTRNEFTKKYVPGPSVDSYMVIEEEIIPYLGEKTINGNKVAFMRGLWKVKNDFMGGPFINASVLNKDKEEVITVDGFIYGPEVSKRDYLRQLESIIYTLDIKE
ncbi:MAG: DUF4837 family protein [Bacteroidota bacterium]